MNTRFCNWIKSCIYPEIANASERDKGAALMGFKQPLSGASARTVYDKLSESVSVKDFGAKGDGVSDDTKAFQDALDSGASIFIPKGQYKIARQLHVTNKNVHMTGEGRDSIISSADFVPISGDHQFFNIQGNGLTLLGINPADINSGDHEITMAAIPDVDVGDTVVLHNPADYSYNKARPYYTSGEMLSVKAVSGNSISFTSGTYDSYAAGAVNIYKMETVSVVMRDFQIMGSPTTDSEYGLNLLHCRDVHISNVRIFDGGLYNGFSFTKCLNVSLDGCEAVITQFGDLASNAYPIIISNSQDIKISNTKASSPWHAIAVGGGTGAGAIVNRGISSVNCTYETTQYIFPADFHGNTEHCGYYNCTLVGGGATMGGNYNSFIGNTIVSISSENTAGNASLCFYGSEITGFGHTIANNTAEINGWYPWTGFGQFVNLAPHPNVTFLYPGNLLVEGNNVNIIGQPDESTTNKYLIGITNRGAAGDSNVSITGNSFLSKYASRGRLYVWGRAENHFDKVVITDNLLDGFGISVDYADRVRLAGNEIDQTRFTATNLVTLTEIASQIQDEGRETYIDGASWTDILQLPFITANWSTALIKVDVVSSNSYSYSGSVMFHIQGHAARTPAHDTTETGVQGYLPDGNTVRLVNSGTTSTLQAKAVSSSARTSLKASYLLSSRDYEYNLKYVYWRQ